SLLTRYTGQADVCIGTPIAGRRLRETEDMLRLFVNMLVLRSPLRPGATFDEILDLEREVTLEALAHQDTPFEAIVNALKLERSLGRSPIFQVQFILQNTPPARDTFDGLTQAP